MLAMWRQRHSKLNLGARPSTAIACCRGDVYGTVAETDQRVTAAVLRDVVKAIGERNTGSPPR
jgi:hypothetical protein